MHFGKRAFYICLTAASGLATTVLSCIATDKAKQIVRNPMLTRKDKIVGVVKCYAAPVATAATSVIAAKTVIDGFNGAIGIQDQVINERQRVFRQYREGVRDLIGTNKEAEMFDAALYDAAWLPPKRLFESLKPNEMLFFDSVRQCYFIMPYAKMMQLDKKFLDKVNAGKSVDANEYYKAAGIPLLPEATEMAWYANQKWDDFFYYAIYDVNVEGQSLGKMAIIHEYCPLDKKEKDIIDVECKEITDENATNTESDK